MNHEAALYEKALRKQLHCTGNTKKHLLQRFHSALTTYLEDHPSPTASDLQTAFGPPEDMAKVLMESVCNAEIVRFDQLRKWKRIATITLAALLLVLMVYIFFWKEKPVVGVGEIIEGTTATSNKEVGE